MYAHSVYAGVCPHVDMQGKCVKSKRTVHGIQPVLWVDYVSRNLAAAQHGTTTMEGDNLIVLNGGIRVNAPPAGSCQVVISHYGRWRTQRNPTMTPVRTGGTPEGKYTDDFLSLSLWPSVAPTHTFTHTKLPHYYLLSTQLHLRYCIPMFWFIISCT